jgi:hypothetical protein
MSLAFVSPMTFAGQLDAIDPASVRVGDLHFSPPWFQLLALAAMPVSAKLALGAAGDGCYLPLMTSDELPGQVHGLSNFYTPLFALLNEAQVDRRRLGELAGQLRDRAAGFHGARFSPMDPESLSWSALRDAFSNAGWLTDDYFIFGNWYHPVGGQSYADYLAARPSPLRNTLARAQRRLEKDAGYSLRICPGQDLTDADIDAFVTVYNRSWKKPEPYPDFIPGLCRLAARAGWLRLGIVRLDGRPVAAQLWLVGNGKANIVKLAYDRDYAKTSAGTVLSAALMRHVIDVDRVDEIDYLIGDDAYKRDWMSCRRERRGLIAFNPAFPRGLLGAARHSAGKLKRRFFG